MRLSTLKKKRIKRKRFKERQMTRDSFYTGKYARGTPEEVLSTLVKHFKRNGYPSLFYNLKMRDDYIIEIYVTSGMKKAAKRIINSVPWADSHLYCDSIIKDISEWT